MTLSHKITAGLLSGLLMASAPVWATSPVPTHTLFTTFNKEAVANGGKPPNFTLSTPTRIESILTYHWNNARGTQRPGEIALRMVDKGHVIGHWHARGEPGMNGVPNANWFVEPNLDLPAGRYEILDSDPASWSQNGSSQGLGMVEVRGAASLTPSIPEVTPVQPKPPTPSGPTTSGPSTPPAPPAGSKSSLLPASLKTSSSTAIASSGSSLIEEDY